jgi:hypothetical protein
LCAFLKNFFQRIQNQREILCVFDTIVNFLLKNIFWLLLALFVYFKGFSKGFHNQVVKIVVPYSTYICVQLDLDRDRVEECVEQKLNSRNLTGALCAGSNSSSHMRATMEQLGIVYGEEESTRRSCAILHTTHFPEVQ